jgi:hypothetical protein
MRYVLEPAIPGAPMRVARGIERARARRYGRDGLTDVTDVTRLSDDRGRNTVKETAASLAIFRNMPRMSYGFPNLNLFRLKFGR